MKELSAAAAHRVVHWSLFQLDHWQFYLAATERGLCYVGSPNQPFDELAAWAAKKLPGSRLVEDNQSLAPYAEEIAGYLKGSRAQFTLPSDCRGTDFQQQVWQALLAIPYGETRSYSEIAAMIGRPAAVRAVGAAIGANPNLITIPCHRAIGKNGTLTGFRGGLAMKSQLLQLEREGAMR